MDRSIHLALMWGKVASRNALNTLVGWRENALPTAAQLRRFLASLPTDIQEELGGTFNQTQARRRLQRSELQDYVERVYQLVLAVDSAADDLQRGVLCWDTDKVFYYCEKRWTDP